MSDVSNPLCGRAGRHCDLRSAERRSRRPARSNRSNACPVRDARGSSSPFSAGRSRSRTGPARVRQEASDSRCSSSAGVSLRARKSWRPDRAQRCAARCGLDHHRRRAHRRPDVARQGAVYRRAGCRRAGVPRVVALGGGRRCGLASLGPHFAGCFALPGRSRNACGVHRTDLGRCSQIAPSRWRACSTAARSRTRSAHVPTARKAPSAAAPSTGPSKRTRASSASARPTATVPRADDRRSAKRTSRAAVSDRPQREQRVAVARDEQARTEAPRRLHPR